MPDHAASAKATRFIIFREEWFLAVSVLTCLLFFLFGAKLTAQLENPGALALVFIWLFGAILGSIFSVVRHADHVAVRLGEPYGTLILTLVVTAVEVTSISAIMLHGENNPTLARDTIFAVVMIVLNGMVGLSLLAGGWRHREQQYNFQGANAYLSVLIPLATLSLLLPHFTISTPGPTLSVAQETFLAVITVALYGTFLSIQTDRHRKYFVLGEGEEQGHEAPRSTIRPLGVHAALLIAFMAPLVYLAEQFAKPVDYVIETMRAPAALGGIAIAALVATPEAIAAVQAARANRLQRSVNVMLGSVLATIGLTVPAMIVISHLTGRSLHLGLQDSGLVLLPLTLIVAVVTFASGRTNILQGLVHLVLFATYIVLVFQG